MRVLVLDLRGNPGGLLNVAVDIAGRFVDSGLIVSTRGRAQGQTQMLAASGQARWRMPLYVLVDHDSASASEILAGALQDHQRATIVGGADLRQGLGAEHLLAAIGPRRAQADDRQVLLAPEPALQRAGRPARPARSSRASAAKPVDDNAQIREEANFGDPALDPVLAAAIRTAKERRPERRRRSRLSRTRPTTMRGMPPVEPQGTRSSTGRRASIGPETAGSRGLELPIGNPESGIRILRSGLAAVTSRSGTIDE